MRVTNHNEKIRLGISLSLLSTLAIVLVYLAMSGKLSPLVSQLWEIFKDRDQMRIYVQSWGAWAPAAFIVIQALQVVLAPIPGEFTGAVGGFIFGGPPTILYSSLGLTIGSIVAFLAARIMGLPLVRLIVSKESLERFHFLTERKGALLALVLFVIPGFPKDMLSYILGLSPMRFATFVTVCALGRIPGTIMLSISGSALYHENWTLLIVLAALCGIAMGSVFWWRTRIELWLSSSREDSSERSGGA